MQHRMSDTIQSEGTKGGTNKPVTGNCGTRCQHQEGGDDKGGQLSGFGRESVGHAFIARFGTRGVGVGCSASSPN